MEWDDIITGLIALAIRGFVYFLVCWALLKYVGCLS